MINTELKKIKIFDTTLRDGEQSPGAAMTHEEKLRIAELLDEMGVDIIEAGFPISSPGDFKAVSEISKIVKRASVCGLSRAVFKDTDRAGEAVKGAHRPRIHTFISTSPVHMKHKLNMGENAVLEAIGASVTRARSYTSEVEWSAEDATRTIPDFLCKCVEVAIHSGATVINVPDTVGYSTPQEFFDIITMLRTRVPNADKVIFSTHCHNDLGVGVANSLAGVLAGARQVECTINGIGERAGNAALEEIVMALKVRKDIMPFTTNINTTLLNRASKLVSNVTGFPVQYNKAIVGKNAFSHESGIHQDGMLKHVETYEIMRPEDAGVSATPLMARRVESATGLTPVASLTLQAEGKVKSVTTSGDGPVDAIFMAIREAYPYTASLQLFQISAVTEGTDAQAQVSVRLEENGRTVTGKASDTDTMVAAAYAYVNALNKLLVKREKQAPEALTVAR